MEGVGAKIRVAVPVLVTILIGLCGLYGLLKPVSNGCVMTYMYPTYIPISPKNGGSYAKYGLYLYHEGWKKIDFNEHLKQLSGVPVLFIPGNGGSYKQVRSLAAECDRAFQAGPLEPNFYQEVHLTPKEGGLDSMDGFELPNQYASRLNWFAVDLEGEHSAMDGRILEEHTEYVVYAIHRILDQYKQSHDAREREGAASSISLPTSVILVGHSMGGFVARAAIVHPQLRKFAVETVLTLSTPHQSPPLALQPSLGHFFTHVNQEWKKGHEIQITRTGHMPNLSKVVVVSVSGGYNDYQVRSKLESLDGIVPSTHGFMISTTGMKNVWLSMEHQAILWCNQLVVQVSHTLLSLIDSKTDLPFPETTKRLAVFSRMLRSGIPETFNWARQSQPSHQLTRDSVNDVKTSSGSQVYVLSDCPSNINWNNDALERDLFIQTNSMTVLAMDGRRRWMDIRKLGSNGKGHFIFVTNLAPCFGVRLHLWPEKEKSTSEEARGPRIMEVTSKLVQIPSRPAPRQVEPGSQTEQAPPSSVLQLSPEDMRGFRFLTISVAPRPSLSGRPPPAASMAVGQFFNPEEGKTDLPALLMLFSTYSQKDILLPEDHPLAFRLSFSISLGLLPVTVSMKTMECGIKRPELSAEETEEMDNSKLCKLRCFPPLALAWDQTSGLHIFPNLDGEKVIVDSSPAMWSSTEGSEKTTVLLLADPHCSYKMSIAVSEPAAARRFLLLYNSQIVGFCISVIFFALMRQAHSWDLDLPIPSLLTAVESNLRMPLPFLILGVIPIFVSLSISLLMSRPLPSFASFIIVALICYLIANGSTILLISVSQFVFYAAATIHVFIKKRWQGWEGSFCFGFLHWFINLSSSFISLKVVRVVRLNPLLVTAITAITLGCLFHPAFGLFILVLSHAICCHNALCSFLTASFRSHARRNELFEFKDEGNERTQDHVIKHKGEFIQKSPLEEKSSDSPKNSKSYGDTQLEIFNHCHGLFILHLLAALMFVPSLVAWFQRIGLGHSFPWFLDSTLCIGVILHGVFNSKPECNSVISIPTILRLNFLYLLAGYYSYLSGLSLEPYKVFYAMAAVGFISFILRILKRNRENGEPRFGRKKHSHKH